MLGALAGCALVASYADVRTRTRLNSLVRRSRWLLVAMAVLFSWGTPGLYLIPDANGLAPTLEGLALALESIVRLLAILAAVSLLLARMPTDQLVSGLHALLASVGDGRDRVAVRIMLVLRYVESGDPGRWLLGSASDEPSGGEILTLHRRGIAPAEYALLALALAGALVVLLM
jgi:energy-coupling factor transporter transmembrane protein EcfT